MSYFEGKNKQACSLPQLPQCLDIKIGENLTNFGKLDLNQIVYCKNGNLEHFKMTSLKSSLISLPLDLGAEREAREGWARGLIILFMQDNSN